MRCCFCHDAEATETLQFCKACFDDPFIPSYQYVKVGLHEWQTFSRWKEIWMSWWWIDGRKKYKNPLKKNGKPKKEKWIRLYCARSERDAKLLVRQIERSLSAGKEGTKDSKSRDRELDLLSGFDQFRIIEPELPPTKGRQKGKHAEISENPSHPLSTADPTRPGCPGCGRRKAKKVKKGDKKLWKCESCGRRWPRSSGEAPEKPSKGLKAKSATPVAEKRPRKRQKPAKKRAKK